MGIMDSIMNDNGQPEGWGTPIIIDGGYKSNNRNLDVQPSPNVFDPKAGGVGPWNTGYGTSNTNKPFSK